jgi:hypothetical protein
MAWTLMIPVAHDRVQWKQTLGGEPLDKVSNYHVLKDYSIEWTTMCKSGLTVIEYIYNFQNSLWRVVYTI